MISNTFSSYLWSSSSCLVSHVARIALTTPIEWVSHLVFCYPAGDMFHLAVSTKDNGAFCERDDLEGPTRDFCNGQLTKSYLRVYVSLRSESSFILHALMV